jgi:hypothetical protein
VYVIRTTGSNFQNISKVIPGSERESLAYIDIKTAFIGDYSEIINVVASANGVKRISQNEVSLIRFDSFNKTKKSVDKVDLCDSKSNLCIISGNHSFNKKVIFTEKTYIGPGTKIFLGKGVDLIFESSVSMNGDPKFPIVIYGNGTGGVYIKNSEDELSNLKNVVFLILQPLHLL